MAELTIVYSIADDAKFRAEEMPRLMKLLEPGPQDGAPYRIHAMSRDDENMRVALITEALDRYGETSEAAEVIREIVQCADISAWRWGN